MSSCQNVKLTKRQCTIKFLTSVVGNERLTLDRVSTSGRHYPCVARVAAVALLFVGVASSRTGRVLVRQIVGVVGFVRILVPGERLAEPPLTKLRDVVVVDVAT